MSKAKTTTKDKAPAKANEAETKKIDNSPEAKTERFKTVMSRRTLNVLKTLNNMANCSNKNVYAYTPEQIDTVFNSIEQKLAEVKKKYQAAESKKAVSFSL